MIDVVLRIIEKALQITEKVIDGQPPDVKAEMWRRYLAETEWWHKLLAKLSDKIEPLIDKQP